MAKRGHGEGTIRKHKNGKWEARLSIGYDPMTGKLKQVSKYFKTRKEGQDWLIENQHNINTGRFIEPDKLTLGDWVKRWLTVYVKPGIRPTSYANYVDAANLHIIPALGHIPIQSLRTNNIQELYNLKSTEGLSGFMVQRIHRVLSGALKQAVKENLIPFNSAEHTTRPKIKRKEILPLSIEEANKYLETARSDSLYPAFLLELTSGLRRGELLAIDWNNVDFAKGEIAIKQSLCRVRYIDEGKTKLELTDVKTEASKRVIPLLKDVVMELKKLKAKQIEERLFFGQCYHNNNLVFCSEDGKPVDPRNFHRKHTSILKKAGIRHVRVHDLRHSFATILLQEGENPENLRDMLGHTRTSTTMDLYCHSTIEGKRKAVNRLCGIIKG
jgi:integrase